MSKVIKPMSIRKVDSIQVKDQIDDELSQRVTIPSLDKTGILRYVGEVDNKAGIWAGIELDIGQGKNDGSVQGKRYFNCPANSGIFIGVDKIIIHPPPLTKRKSNLPSKTSKTIKTPKNSFTPNKKSTTPIKKSSTPKTSFTPTKKSITTQLKKSSTPQSNRTSFTPTPKTSSVPKNTPTPKTSSVPKKSLTPPPRASFTPTPRTSSTPNASPISTKTSKQLKRHSLNSNTFTKRSHHLRHSSIPLDIQDFTSSINHHSPSSLDSTTALNTSINSKTSSIASSRADTPKLDETSNQLYEMLEKSQQERDKLALEIKTKEAAWERLVSSKESLSLRVEEFEIEKRRLTRDLKEAQDQIKLLQSSIHNQTSEINQQRHDRDQAVSDQKRMNRLEQVVQDLQRQLTNSKTQQQQQEREHTSVLRQLHQQAMQSQETAASLEKECHDLRRAGLEAMQAYEDTVWKLRQQHQLEIDSYRNQLQKVESNLLDLRQPLYGEEDRHAGLVDHLDSTLNELDQEREVIQQLTTELDQTRRDLTHQRQLNQSIQSQLDQSQQLIQNLTFENKRLMKEGDRAFELQAKAEDELYQLKISKRNLEQEFHQLSLAHQLQLDTYQSDTTRQTWRMEQSNDWLEEELKKERKKVIHLQKELTKALLMSPTMTATTTSPTPRPAVDYCDLYDENHDIISSKSNPLTLFCEYCDKYGNHLAETCPNQYETF